MKIYIVINNDNVKRIYTDRSIEVEVINYDKAMNPEQHEQLYYYEQLVYIRNNEVYSKK